MKKLSQSAAGRLYWFGVIVIYIIALVVALCYNFLALIAASGLVIIWNAIIHYGFTENASR